MALACNVSSWLSAGDLGLQTLLALSEWSGHGLWDAGNADYCAMTNPGFMQVCIVHAGGGSLGTCVPSSCLPSDFADINSGLPSFVMSQSAIVLYSVGGNASALAQSLARPGAVRCGMNEVPVDFWRALAIAILSVIGFVCIAATACTRASSAISGRAKGQVATRARDAAPTAGSASATSLIDPPPHHSATVTVPFEVAKGDDDLTASLLHEDLGATAARNELSTRDGAAAVAAMTISREQDATAAPAAAVRDSPPLRQSAASVLVRSFDLERNWDELLRVQPHDKDAFPLIHFLRVLASAWVVAGHSTSMWLSGGLSNLATVIPPDGGFAKWPAQWVLAAEFAVDEFFFIGGFLAFFVLLGRSSSFSSSTSSKPKYQVAAVGDSLCGRVRSGCIQVFFATLLRWLRLVPLLAASFLISWGILPLIGWGPFWNGLLVYQQYCEQYWWTNFLFINDLVPFDDNFARQCRGETWYLATDFQMAIVLVSLGVAVKLGSRRWVVAALLCLSSAASVAYAVSALNHYYPSTPNLFAYDSAEVASLPKPSVTYYDAYYGRPWTRWPAVALGALSFLLHAKMQRELGTGLLGARLKNVGSCSGTTDSSGSSSSNGQLPLSINGAVAGLIDRRPMLSKGDCEAAGQEGSVRVAAVDASRASLTSRIAHAVLIRWWPITVALAIGIILTLISVTMTAEVAPGWSKGVTVAYNACSKPLFIIALGAIFLVTLHHRDALYNRFFGHAVFQVLGKLTFGLYLSHIPIILCFTGSVATYQRMSVALVLQTFCGAYLCALACAAILYVTVELPAANLVKAFVQPLAGRRSD